MILLRHKVRGAQMHDTDKGWNSLNVYLMGKEQRLVDAGGQPGQCRNQECGGAEG